MKKQLVLSFTVLCIASRIYCAPLLDSQREGRQWNPGYGYDYTVSRPFYNRFNPTQSRYNTGPYYFGNGVAPGYLNSGYAGSSAYGMTYAYPSGLANSVLLNRLQSTGIPSGSYSNVNTGSFASANGMNSYGTAGTRISTPFGSFPGLLIASGQIFNPGFGSSLSGTGFTGSQFANGNGFVGIQSQVSGGGFSSLLHSGSVSNTAYSLVPSQDNVISNKQSTATKEGTPINSAASVANMENSGAQGATSTNVKAVSKTQSEGKGYSTSQTHSEAQGYSDGETGTVSANIETQSTSKGTATSESIGNADALAHGTTEGGNLKTNSNVTATEEDNLTEDGPEIVKVSSIKSHAGGKETRPATYTHVYNSGPIPEIRKSVVLPEPPNAVHNAPSTNSLPINQVSTPVNVAEITSEPGGATAKTTEINPVPINDVKLVDSGINNDSGPIPEIRKSVVLPEPPNAVQNAPSTNSLPINQVSTPVNVAEITSEPGGATAKTTEINPVPINDVKLVDSGVNNDSGHIPDISKEVALEPPAAFQNAPSANSVPINQVNAPINVAEISSEPGEESAKTTGINPIPINDVKLVDSSVNSDSEKMVEGIKFQVTSEATPSSTIESVTMEKSTEISSPVGIESDVPKKSDPLPPSVVPEKQDEPSPLTVLDLDAREGQDEQSGEEKPEENGESQGNDLSDDYL